MAQATLHKILEGHTNRVCSVAFSPDNKLIASASEDKTVRLWNIPNGDLNAELKGHTSSVWSVAFSPDGKSIVTGSWDKTVRTWSVATKQEVKILTGHSSDVRSVAWSPNGDLTASGSSDKTVILWDAISGSAKKKFSDHTSSVFSVSFSQNGNKLASAGYDNTVIIWDVNSGTGLIKLAHSSYVWSVCFSHDDQFVVTGCHDHIVRTFDANNGREEKRFEGHPSSVRSVAFSFDGSIIASGDGTGGGIFGGGHSSVRLWDVASTKQLQKLDGHTQTIWSVAFSRDGKFIASASDDKTVCLWNAPSSLQRQILPKPVSPQTNKSETETQQNQNVADTEKRKQQEIEKQQKVAAELEKQKQELIAKQQEIEKQQKEIERLKSELEKQKKQEEEAKKFKVNLDPTKFRDWSVDQVCAYLEKAGIDANVVNTFRQENIDGMVLNDLGNHDDLNSMGIIRTGDRLKVIKTIHQLVSSSSSVNNSGLKVHEIPRRELTKETKLNEGKFGIVWRGTYNGIPVAIKEPILYGDADLNAAKQLADLVEEATVMTSISIHPNVLHCYGISRIGEDDCLLATELCNLGSLDAFLRAYPGTPAVDRRRFSQQVARGLNHLGKHNVAHRDVAARNVLLHDQGGSVIVAKVCDFGLSRQREGEYYVLSGEHLLSPETAPEVYETRKHSTRSDVWSFGVLLWEVESLCATRAKPNKAAFPPLTKPAQADDNMYAIMLKCWAKDPHQRPSFEALIDMLA